MTRLAVFVVAFAAFGACATVEPTIADRVRAVETQVWSPYCPGRLLSECSTRQAQELREQIADRLRSGDTTEEVMTWFAGNFGEERIARLPSGATGVAVWAVPAVAALAGLVLLGGLLRRWTRPAATGGTATVQTSPVEPTPEAIEAVRDEVQRDL